MSPQEREVTRNGIHTKAQFPAHFSTPPRTVLSRRGCARGSADSGGTFSGVPPHAPRVSLEHGVDTDR